MTQAHVLMLGPVKVHAELEPQFPLLMVQELMGEQFFPFDVEEL